MCGCDCVQWFANSTNAFASTAQSLVRSLCLILCVHSGVHVDLLARGLHIFYTLCASSCTRLGSTMPCFLPQKVDVFVRPNALVCHASCTPKDVKQPHLRTCDMWTLVAAVLLRSHSLVVCTTPVFMLCLNILSRSRLPWQVQG